MKRQGLMVFLGVILLLFVVSCTPQASRQKNLYVTIEDGTPFPEYLVGTWRQDDKIEREFVFTSDGRLESIVFGLGLVRLQPGEILHLPLKNGGKGVYVPGKWDVTYDNKSRQLGIQITIDSFKMQVGQQIIEGKTTELFIGTISEDGTCWTADYISYPEYYATTEDGLKHRLMDGEEMMEETIVFKKIKN